VAALVGLLTVPQSAGLAPALPSFKTRELLIHWDAAAGTSRQEMVRVISRATQELRALPGVQNVDGHIGRAILSDAITDVSSGEIWLTIDEAADHDQTVAAVRRTVDGYPGVDTAVVTYPAERIDEVLSGGEHDVVVRVYGHELSVLRDRAEAVRDATASVPGVVDASVLAPVDEASLEVVVDLEAADVFGLRAGDIRRAATTLLSGIEVGLLFEEQKVFEVVVWGKPDLRTSIASVENLLIEAPAGYLVRLDRVADVRIAPTPSVITREGVRRIMEVGVNLDGRDVASVLSDIDAAVGRIEFPLEYHAEVFSDAADRQAAESTLLAIMAAAAIAVFLLLQAVVTSWRLAALVFVTIPTAVAGGILTASLGGELASIGTMAGLLAVLAISVRTSISLIDHFQRLERTGRYGSGQELVMVGAQDRLGPTLTTVLATAVGVLPFFVLGEAAGLEVARPMAIFMLGGLVTSTLVTLFVVPDIYMRAGPTPEAATAVLTEQPALEPTLALERST
jgi:Cu/Ag efflux pump CusA